MAVAMVVGLRELTNSGQPDFVSDMWFTPSHARAALDSLADLDFKRADRPAGPYVLRPRGTVNGAIAAVALWRDSLYARVSLAYGDTLRATSPRRANWLASADWTAVDTLIAAAPQPWRLTGDALGGPDSTGRLLSALLAPGPILTTTRAMLARARRSAEQTPRRADSIVVAAITIGRRLQEDVLLPHVLIGHRVEGEALDMLIELQLEADRDTETLEEYQDDREDGESVLRQAFRLIRHAGSLAELAPGLARLAGDPKLPLAIRSELVLAIGYGWALTPAESGVISPLRRDALESLARRDTSGLAAVVRAATSAVRTGFTRRLILSNEYQALANDILYGRFSRPR